jgi:argininosuccinate lyase
MKSESLDKIKGPAGGARKQQLWGERLRETPEMRNIAYCAGRDVAERPMADHALIPYDVWQNRAHVVMLAEKRIIQKGTVRLILRALEQFERGAADGSIQLDAAKEDVHTNIEYFVAQQVGDEVSGRMHTGRSRNDQTTTVVRLYVRDRLLEFGESLRALLGALMMAAEKFVDLPVAGYTHYQPACVTTVGHWLASYSQAILRDLGRLERCYDRLNFCPLGAAAAFGTSWPIDRTLTARLLGFSAPQANTLDCVTNRWEMEADAATVVAFAMTHLSTIAQDLIILSSPQLGIIEIADRYITGSSIMPQKRNPDFAEVTRAKAALVQQLTASLFGIARGALSGYNRDTQWTKYVIMDIFDEAAAAPAVFGGVFSSMHVNAKRAIDSARQNFVDAVDIADVLARESNLPFRVAYNIVSRAVKLSEDRGSVDLAIVRKLAREAGAKKTKLEIGDPRKIVARKNHDGGPAPDAVRKNLAEQKLLLGQLSRTLAERQAALQLSREELAEKMRSFH